MQLIFSFGQRMSRSAMVLFAATVTALVLSACGGGSDESITGEPQNGSPPPSAPAPVVPVAAEPLPIGVDPTPAASTSAGAVPNVLLVRFRSGTPTETIRHVIGDVGGAIIGSVPLTMMVQVRFEGDWTDARVDELIARLEGQQSVRGAYRDEIQSAPTSVVKPGDPWSADIGLSVAWDGDYQTGWNWHLKAMRADEAWHYAYAEGRTVHPVAIGILDGGFTEHPDLVGMTILGKQVLSPAGISGAAHGNHVAGIAAATGDNGRGIAGVTWRDATLTVVDGLDSTYADLWLRRRCFCLPQSVIEQGLATLIEQGVKVINMSLGQTWWDPLVHTVLPEGSRWLPTMEADRQAILVRQRKLALDMLEALHFADKDVLLIQSAGNASGDAAFNGHAASALWSTGEDDDETLRQEYPTLDKIRERLLVVGALGPASASTLSPSWYSNTGRVVDVWAPGGSGNCDDQPGCAILSTGSDGGLLALAGTSMAAPTVAGLAGLLWQTNDGLAAGEIKRLITLKDRSGRTQSGFTVVTHDHGMQVNARDSVIAALRIDNRRPVARATARRGGAELLLDGTASSDPEGTAIASYVWVVADASGRTLVYRQGADLASWTYTPPARQTVTITLTVIDQLGLRSRTVALTVTPEEDPVVQPTLAAPTLDAPSNGEVGTGLTPTLRWSGGSAPNLELNVRDVASGAMVVTASLAGSATSYTLPAGVLFNGRRYRWNMSACPDAACASGFVVSSSFEFATAAAVLVAPTLSAPANGSTGIDLRPTLRWFGGSAPSLELNLRDVATGTMVVTASLAGSATSYALPAGALVNGRRYRWNVSACPDAACASGFVVSSSHEFTTAAAPLAAPTLSSPSNGTTGVELRPTLRWSGASAPSLELNVRDVVSGAMVVTASLAGSATSYTLPAGALVNGRRYRWNVSACPDAACASGFIVSSSFEFTTAAALLVAPALGSPANGATGVDLRPTLRWTGGSVPNLELNVRDVASGVMVATVGLAGSATSYTLPVGVLTSGRRYRWNVSACPDAACASGFVVSSSFEFTTAAAPLVAPTLSSPSNGTTGVELRPTLRWSGASAPNLELNVRDVVSGAMVVTASLDGSSTSYTLPAGALVNGRRYRWNVSACPDAACASGFVVSSSFEFTTAAALLVAPALGSPANGATGVDLRPTLRWTGGSAPNLELNVRDVASGVMVATVGLAGSATSFTLPAGVLTGGRRYRWNVSACPDAACTSGFVVSSSFEFTTRP